MLPRSVVPVAACSGQVGQVEDSGTSESMTFGFVEDEGSGPAEQSVSALSIRWPAAVATERFGVQERTF